MFSRRVPDQIAGYFPLFALLNFPERIRPLLSALNVADYGIIEVNSIDAALGESMVAFSSSGIERGDLIINPKDGAWIDPDKVNLVKDQAGLSSWNVNHQVPDLNEYRSAYWVR